LIFILHPRNSFVPIAAVIPIRQVLKTGVKLSPVPDRSLADSLGLWHAPVLDHFIELAGDTPT
jgi:hypothetical protein